MAKDKLICTTCKGDDVRVDAYAMWDVDSQSFALTTTFKGSVCEDCGGKCSTEWVPADPVTA